MITLFIAYLVTAVLSGGGLGAGDVRTAGPVGLALAWHSWSAVLTGTVLSLLCFMALAAVSRCSKLDNRADEIPFGPAMFTGTFLIVLAE